MKKQIAVIGLGEFGQSVVNTLVQEGVDVLVLDRDEEKIQEMADKTSQAIVIDSTDERALRKVGVPDMDAVVIAIGHNIQASILTTMIVKELGVKMIVSKATNKAHGKLLEKIGADRIVYPESEMGVRVAHSLSSINLLEEIQLSNEYSLAEIKTPNQLVGMTLKDAKLRSEYGVNVIAIKRNVAGAEKIDMAPRPEVVLKAEDILFVFGQTQDINSFKTKGG